MGHSVKSSLVNPRVIRLEIDTIGPPEQKGRLIAAFRMYAFAATRIIRRWLILHEEVGTPDKILKGSAIGPAFPGDWKSQLYRVGTSAAPYINPTSIQWMFQWLQRTLSEQSSARNNRKRWVAILQGTEHHPLFTELPLRIYSSFAKIEEDDQGLLHLKAKLLRDEIGGPYIPLDMRLRKPHTKSHQEDYEKACQVCRGERRLPCSQIVYSRGKLYLMLTIDIGAKPQIDNQRTLILRAGNRSAYVARFNGKTASIGNEWLIELGKHRRQLIAGRGGNREVSARNTRKWCNYTKQVAHHITAEIATKLIEYKIGRVVILDGRTTSALNMAGITKPDISSFPMQMMRIFLQQKVSPYGIKVIERANLRSIKERIARRKRRRSVNPASK